MILHLEFTMTVVITSTIFILQEHLAAVISWLLCTFDATPPPPRTPQLCMCNSCEGKGIFDGWRMTACVSLDCC